MNLVGRRRARPTRSATTLRIVVFLDKHSEEETLVHHGETEAHQGGTAVDGEGTEMMGRIWAVFLMP
jgi:hypothetical protein